MLIGEAIKNAIKGAGFTMDSAATFLGLSRQTLYIKLNQSVLDKAFLNKVKKDFKPYFDLDEIIEKHSKSDTDGILALNPPKEGMAFYINRIEYLENILDERDKRIKLLEEFNKNLQQQIEQLKLFQTSVKSAKQRSA